MADSSSSSSSASMREDVVNRLINHDRYVAPSATILSDRFIPCRSSSKLFLFNLPSSSSSSSPPTSPYISHLQTALFSTHTPSNIFRFKIETRQQPVPLPVHVLNTTKQQQSMIIPSSPSRVLAAPELADDFHFNLLDWSSNNYLAVGLGNSVYLWNHAAREVTQLCDIDDTVCSLQWALSSTQLAIATDNGQVQIWDASRSKRLRTFEGHTDRVAALAWSSSLLSSGSRDKTIIQRDIRAKQDCIHKLSSHLDEVCGLKWSPDHRHLASGGTDNNLFVWNQHATRPILKNCKHTAAVKAIAWSPHRDGLLASGGGTTDQCIRFWNTNINSHLSCIETGSQVCNLAWSKNVNELVSTHGFSENAIFVWRYPTMSKLVKLTGHTERVLYLATSPDGQTIVTGAGDETLCFWDVFPHRKCQTIESAFAASSRGRSTIRLPVVAVAAAGLLSVPCLPSQRVSIIHFSSEMHQIISQELQVQDLKETDLDLEPILEIFRLESTDSSQRLLSHLSPYTHLNLWHKAR
ncbi:Cell division cycle 20.2 cofactor of APC complex [Euphorbia peplus]|nr:Cell division cycle 20.2 cofactor of APC complex [Euphorbia peplus]